MNDVIAPPAILAGRLAPGERLLWTATPDLRHVHVPWLRLIPGGLFLGISAMLVYVGVSATPASVASLGPSGYGSLLTAALAVPFIAAGVGVLRDFVRVRSRVPHAVYALTDRRIVIANTRYPDDWREIALADVCGIQRWDRRAGFAGFEFEDNRQAKRELVLRSFLLDGIADADAFEARISGLTGVPVTSKRNARAYARVQGRGAGSRLS
jgi:hypothetical protein